MFRAYHRNDAGALVNMIPIPLGDLTAGRYSFNLTTSNGILDPYSPSVTDAEGEDYPVLEGSPGVFTFTLPRDVRRLSLVGDTEAEDIQVSYQVQKVSSDTSDASTTTASTSSVSRVHSLPWFFSALLLAFTVALVL
jgi:hypothetical protein